MKRVSFSLTIVIILAFIFVFNGFFVWLFERLEWKSYEWTLGPLSIGSGILAIEVARTIGPQPFDTLLDGLVGEQHRLRNKISISFAFISAYSLWSFIQHAKEFSPLVTFLSGILMVLPLTYLISLIFVSPELRYKMVSGLIQNNRMQKKD